MLQENVKVVQRLFEVFNAGWERGDPEAVFDSGTVTDDLEFVVFPGLPGHPPSYRGRDGFLALAAASELPGLSAATQSPSKPYAHGRFKRLR